MRLDLHIHSRHSFDSVSRVGDIIKQARRAQLNGVAITDHDSFAGSEEALDIAPGDFCIIPGAEYTSDQGHLLAYFIKEGLEKRGFSRDALGRFHWQDILGEAHNQGGLVFLAHPFKPIREHDLLLWEQLDGVEVYNSRAALGKNLGANVQALQIADVRQKPFSAGSDAHWLSEVGGAFWEFGPQDLSGSGEPADVVKSALTEKRGRVWGRAASRCYEPASQVVKRWLNGRYADLPRPVAKLAYCCVMEGWRKIGLGPHPLEGWMEIHHD